MHKAHALAFSLSCLAGFALACGSDLPSAPKSADDARAENGVSVACTRFATELCEQLGTDTETCQSLRSVSEWLPTEACNAAQANLGAVLARIETLRGECNALADQLCEAFGEDATLCGEVKRDLREIPAGHCRALRARYPEIAAHLQEREKRARPLGEEEWRALTADDAAAFGPSDAKVTLVEFSDFECPYCSRASEAVHRIREAYGDKVRFVFRHFPLPFHKNARLAAAASLAAHAQGKFWAYHDLLFQNQRSLGREDLLRYARELGLDQAAFEQSLGSATTEARIEADTELGRKVQIEGTPTLFIEGKRVQNPTDFELVSQMIEAELAR